MNKRLKLKNYYKLMIMLGVLCFLNTIIFAAAPSTVTVGLESISKDVASLHIASQNNLVIGYLNEGFFKEEGTLDTNSVTLVKASEEYYFTGSAYHTLKDAREAARTYGKGAAAAYLEPGTYCVYTKNFSDGLLIAPASLTRIALYNDNNELIFVSDNSKSPILLQGSENGCSFPLTQVAKTRKYRGAVGAVSVQNGGITAINVVNLEDYLYGVVPIEMAPSWPLEALKAQAVAARSIAYVQYSRYISKGYNLVDTTACQVYKGYSVESPNSNLAVDETKEEVIKYNNQVAEALYFSTSGGITEDAKYIWGNEVPYLKAVTDSFETEPAQKPWMRTITLDEISACLVKAGINIGQAKGVEIASRTPSGRVQTLTVLGTSSSYTLKNENVRTFFSATNEGSLKSRLFSFSGFVGGQAPIEQPASTMVSIMSADDFVNKDIQNTSIISSKDITGIPQNIAVQSVNDIRTLDLKASNTNSTNGTSTAALQAETVLGDLIIYGQGYGHGLGMSQSGAKGMAKAGYNYKDILTYYYSGITVER